jgi:hypothetical protein
MRLAWTMIPLSFYPASGDDLGKSLLDWKLYCTTRRVERGTCDLPFGQIPYRGFKFDGVGRDREQGGGEAEGHVSDGLVLTVIIKNRTLTLIEREDDTMS